jgi:hypothetical protein
MQAHFTQGKAKGEKVEKWRKKERGLEGSRTER